METKTYYLYGAAIQGIQGFIFQTNTLRDIVGASELVECICTSLFAGLLGYAGNNARLLEALIADENAIVNAAGNIKYLFTSKERCEKVVREFPQKVVEFAPGITVSQAVVELKDDYQEEDFRQGVLALEAKLRAQRNRPMRSTQPGWLGIQQSRQTGLPLIDRKLSSGKELLLDAASFRKLYTQQDSNLVERRMSTQLLFNKAYGQCDARRIPFQLKDITGKNDWIAVIHADGNGLGQVIQRIGGNKEKLKKFSYLLDRATTKAANEAFASVLKDHPAMLDRAIPFRPIVLSGDDHTVICQADLAIPYMNHFIALFEKYTRQLLGDMLKGCFTGKNVDKLTACAGIAFVKSSFPFYYAYNLAESLCSYAKKDTKDLYQFTGGNLPASCLMFHKVQDSFVVDYSDVVKRELTPNEHYNFLFGPYYIYREGNPEQDEAATKAGRWTLEKLMRTAEALGRPEMNTVRSGLRNWMDHLCMDDNLAKQKKERLEMIANKQGKELIATVCTTDCGPVYDVLSLVTVCNQVTQNS